MHLVFSCIWIISRRFMQLSNCSLLYGKITKSIDQTVEKKSTNLPLEKSLNHIWNSWIRNLKCKIINHSLSRIVVINFIVSKTQKRRTADLFFRNVIVVSEISFQAKAIQEIFELKIAKEKKVVNFQIAKPFSFWRNAWSQIHEYFIGRSRFHSCDFLT